MKYFRVTLLPQQRFSIRFLSDTNTSSIECRRSFLAWMTRTTMCSHDELPVTDSDDGCSYCLSWLSRTISMKMILQYPFSVWLVIRLIRVWYHELIPLRINSLTHYQEIGGELNQWSLHFLGSWLYVFRVDGFWFFFAKSAGAYWCVEVLVLASVRAITYSLRIQLLKAAD